MMSFETVIGLEIHAKLNSVNKLFCQCANVQEFDELQPNTHICPVCTAQPGALPVLSQEPVENALLLGKALRCTIQEYSTFERKSYFYPDLPSGYQITQLYKPTCINGSVSFFTDNEFTQTTTVGIRDAHIETDTGKSVRDGEKVFLDFNRAGTPLVEIVTEPDFRSAQEVVAFLKELQRIIRINGIGDAELESGQMRVDVNVSIRPVGSEQFGERVELKNMNSYSAIERAIQHETERQIKLVESGQGVAQETRRRNDTDKDSFCMRSKENAMDYRYMPEPDLPPLHCPSSLVDQLVESHGGVRSGYEIINRYKQEYGFNKEFINGLIADIDLMMFFERTVQAGASIQESAKRLVSSVARWLNQQQVGFTFCKITLEDYLDFLARIADESLSGPQAKIVIAQMLETGEDPVSIIEKEGLKPVDEAQITQRLQELFAQKPDLLTDIQSGNMKPMGFIIGQIMQKSNGSADPQVITKLVRAGL